jgi:hypothetical protein
VYIFLCFLDTLGFLDTLVLDINNLRCFVDIIPHPQLGFAKVRFFDDINVDLGICVYNL